MDSVVADGVSFTESYCTYPVCSPARSSLMTGLMPHETGVMKNGEAIRGGILNLGEHFQVHGYKTYYAGKWHLPGGFGDPPGFEKLIGGHTLGAHMDEPLATKCVEFMHQGPAEPFLLVASFMNPHDVCHWIRGPCGKPRLRFGSTVSACPRQHVARPERTGIHPASPLRQLQPDVEFPPHLEGLEGRRFPALHLRLLPDVRRRRPSDRSSALGFAVPRAGREHGGRADFRPRRGARCSPLDAEGRVLGGDRQGPACRCRQGRGAEGSRRQRCPGFGRGYLADALRLHGHPVTESGDRPKPASGDTRCRLGSPVCRLGTG